MKKGDTIKIKLKVKSNEELPDWGLGPGVLAEQDIVLKEDVNENNKIRYALKVEEVYNNLLADTIEKVIEVSE